MPPEFIKDPKANQKSFELDVYSYGIVLFILITQRNPFHGLSTSQIKTDTVKRKIVNFPPIGISKEWENLVFQCCNQDKLKRTSFTDICSIIEEFATSQIKMNSSYVNSFNKYKSVFRRNENNTYNDC